MKDFFLIASLLLARLAHTEAKNNDNLHELNEIEGRTDAFQNPETCLGTCPAYNPEDRVVLLQNEDCTKYCSCSNGRSIVNVCPEGLHFSFEEQVCSWPSDANCEEDNVTKLVKDALQFHNSNSLNISEDKPEATTESWKNPDTCEGSCPDKDPEDKTILLANKDCTKYCSCSNGRSIVNVCPEGLHFSLEEQVCTWPSDANCEEDNVTKLVEDAFQFHNQNSLNISEDKPEATTDS